MHRHALTGWWRYSQLHRWPLAMTAVLSLAAGVLIGLDLAATWAAVVAAVCGCLTAGQLTVGAIHAEQARRYGCW